MKIKKLTITISAIIMALATVSCSKDNTLRYNNMTMGNMVNGKFVSDQGNTFNVVEQECAGKLDTMHRAFVVCDILNSVNGSDTEYDVRLNYISNVLTKSPVAASEITDEKLLINDPMLLADWWVSGGYVNLYVCVPIKRTGNTPHVLTFIYEDTKKEDGKYRFLIRHNANGETLKDNETNYDMVLAYAYASFPIASIIKEDEAQVIIEWESYLVSNSAVHADSKTESSSTLYSKKSYEQPAISSVNPTTLNIL